MASRTRNKRSLDKDEINSAKGGLSTSPFEKMWMSTKNKIVKSPLEKDSGFSNTLCPFRKGLYSPFEENPMTILPAVLF